MPEPCPELSAHGASPGSPSISLHGWQVAQGVQVGPGGADLPQIQPGLACASEGILWDFLGMPLHPKSTCSWSGDGLSFERTSEIAGVDQSRGHTGTPGAPSALSCVSHVVASVLCRGALSLCPRGTGAVCAGQAQGRMVLGHPSHSQH